MGQMTNKNAYVRLSQGWPQVIHALGLDLAAVLRDAGLPPHAFEAIDLRVTPVQYAALWTSLERATDPERLPLQVVQHFAVSTFDPALLACLSAESLNEGLERIARFKRLVGPVLFRVSRRTLETEISLAGVGNLSPPLGIVLAELAFLARFSRIGTGREVVPVQVRLRQRPRSIDAYAAFFGVVPVTGSDDAIVFRADDGLSKFVTSSRSAWAFYEAPLENRLRGLDTDQTLVERARLAVTDLLPSARCTADALARKLLLSKRSLQRGLAQHGTSFQSIVARTREELARHLLTQSRSNLDNIAFVLGYRDAQSFARAFRSWTGLTPSAFRAARMPEIRSIRRADPGRADAC